MSTTARDLLTAALVEADQHRAEATRLLTTANGLLGERFIAQAHVHADLARSCEQRAANLMNAIEAGMDAPIIKAAEQTAASATGTTDVA